MKYSTVMIRDKTIRAANASTVAGRSSVRFGTFEFEAGEEDYTGNEDTVCFIF